MFFNHLYWEEAKKNFLIKFPKNVLLGTDIFQNRGFR